MVNIYGVEVFAWNPVREDASGRVGNVNNFGDLLGPMLVRKLLHSRGPQTTLSEGTDAREQNPRLLTVGSIVHFAEENDTIWGSGINGKVGLPHHKFSRLDVRAVRGPLTGKWLEENKGIEDPGVYGDPALLLLDVMPHLAEVGRHKRFKLSVIPNFHDFAAYSDLPGVINPRSSVLDVLTRLAQSEQIATSSLHGLVVGELLGVPTALFTPSRESLFKYEDYVSGTGRKAMVCYSDLDRAVSALRNNPHSFDSPLANWDPGPLLKAFPLDLWEPRNDGS